MQKLDLTKVRELRKFITYTAERQTLLIDEIDEIKNDGVRFTLTDEDNNIQFLKFYLTEKGLPFFLKFVKDLDIAIETVKSPMQLLGVKLEAKIVYVNEAEKITKIVEVYPHN